MECLDHKCSFEELELKLKEYLSIQKKEQNLNYLAVKKFYKELKPINPFLNNKHINKC